ncbi:hypothetical protein B0O99DRAFT_656092 [Bisporella sp. PMI_857]|nr:hypothetical protein B0O99DRAFT_656092 [Bisporella sp. PMI_857]
MDFKALPKIELHAHLSGSISRECLHEIWLQKKQDGETDLEDPLIEMPVDKFDYDLETFFPLFSRYIYSLCNDLQSLTYTTNRVLQDFAADGVVYLELRTTPRAMPTAGITTEKYIETILSCIKKHNSNSKMKTSLILSIDRRHTIDTALSVVHLARNFRDQGVIGIDLCGDPSVHPISHLYPAFHLASSFALPLTVHFAESPASSSEEELKGLLELGPKRLGHLCNVPEELRKEILGKGLGVELCLSCNVHAKMITGSFGDHHFGWWWEHGRKGIAVSTDDVGVFLSPLSNEYALLAEHFNLSRGDICELARSPIDTIFGSEEDKERLRRIMWT